MEIVTAILRENRSTYKSTYEIDRWILSYKLFLESFFLFFFFNLLSNRTFRSIKISRNLISERQFGVRSNFLNCYDYVTMYFIGDKLYDN